MHPRPAERGNILFLILLAVVLFAALSYAVTNSIRGGGNDSSDEQARSYAATLMQYGSLVEQAVQRMVLTGGIRPEQLDFSTGSTGVSSAGTNTACTNTSCRIFDSAGGGVVPMKTPAKMRDLSITGNTDSEGNTSFAVVLASVANIGTTLPDLILLQRGVLKKVCDEVNIASGVMTRGGADITDDLGVGNSAGTTGTHFATFGGASSMDPMPSLTANVLGDGDPRLAGRTSFCFLRTISNSGYYVATVLLAR